MKPIKKLYGEKRGALKRMTKLAKPGKVIKCCGKPMVESGYFTDPDPEIKFKCKVCGFVVYAKTGSRSGRIDQAQ